MATAVPIRGRSRIGWDVITASAKAAASDPAGGTGRRHRGWSARRSPGRCAAGGGAPRPALVLHRLAPGRPAAAGAAGPSGAPTPSAASGPRSRQGRSASRGRGARLSGLACPAHVPPRTAAMSTSPTGKGGGPTTSSVGVLTVEGIDTDEVFVTVEAQQHGAVDGPGECRASNRDLANFLPEPRWALQQHAARTPCDTNHC